MKINFISFISFVTFINYIILNNDYYPFSDKLLKKYEKITIPSGNNIAIFDSSEFKKGDTIYFKITANSFIDEKLYYEFYDNYEKQDFSMEENVSPSKSKSGTNYYRIKKDSRVLGSLEGKYLALNFECTGNVEIENTKEDGSKVSTTVIVVVVVVVVIVLVIGIICYCKRRKAMLTQGGTNTEAVNINKNYNNQNYGQQQAQINQNYNQNMNMGNNAITYQNAGMDSNGYTSNNYQNNYNNGYS